MSAATDVLGTDVERITFCGEDKRHEYEAERFVPGNTIVYLEREGRSHVGKFLEVVADGDFKAIIKVHDPLYSSLHCISCHGEKIPYGFDRPNRYEWVIDDGGIKAFEVLGDYDELRAEFKKQIAIMETMKKFAGIDSIRD